MNKRSILRYLIGAVTVSAALNSAASLASAREFTIVDGASNIELAQINRIVTPFGNYAQRLKDYDDIISQYPENRAARILRSKMYMEAGQISLARKDLDAVKKVSGGFSAFIAAEVDLATVTNQKAEAIEAYKAQLAQLNGTDGSELAQKLTKAKILELSGQIDEAEKVWQDLRQYKGAVELLVARQHADFHIRQLKFEAAAKDCSDIFSNVNDLSVEEMAEIHMRWSQVLWAMGKDDESLAQVQKSLQLAKETTNAPLMRSLVIQAVLTIHKLAPLRENTPGDLSDDQKSLLRQYATRDMPAIGLEVAAQAILKGKAAQLQEASAIGKKLNAAPFLEWAMWSEMYLGLESREAFEVALTSLPSDSIQYVILKRYGTRK